MLIAWTSVANLADAEKLASALIELRLVACVQIEGPITSIYRWDGKIERAKEYRLGLKIVSAQLEAAREYVLRHHPYENPEWIAVRADDVAEKYLSWARANSTNPPL